MRNGHADLLGFSREMIEHFSRRRGEIVEYMAERGVSSAAAAEVAAYRTRAEKDYGVDVDRQLADWIARAAEFGLTPESIRETITEALGREPRPIDSEDLEAVLDDLDAHHSHFGRRELICAIATRMVEGAYAGAIRTAVEDVLDDDRVVGLRRGEPTHKNANFTTARLLAMEEKIVAAATGGKAAGAAVIDDATLSQILARHHYLGDQQAEMVRRLTTGGERVAVVAARPGTGKTTALRAAAEGWAAAGFRGIGVSTARSATVEIAEVGLPATSIAKLRIMLAERDERGLPALPPGTVIVVDEASTASTEDLAALLERVEACGGKLVLMGDTRQIGAVAAGGVYADLSHRLEPIELTEIRRQRDPVDRRVVVLAHEGRGSDALDVMEASGRMRIAATHEEALSALALDWHRSLAAGKDAVMVARRNEDVRRLNEMARAFREERGELGGRITVGGVEFAVGDVVMTRVNAPEVSNRERWAVIGVDRRIGAIGVVKIGAADVGATLSRAYLEKTTPGGGPALEHAYALTTYAAQGKTFEETFVMLDPGVHREDFLVAVSRSRGHTFAYGVAAIELVDPELGPSTREISDHLHDLRLGSERVAGEYAAVEVEKRSAIDSMSAGELAAHRIILIDRIAEAAGPAVADDRLAALERRIGSARSRLDSLGAELRQAGEDRDAREAIAARLRQGERQLARLEDERTGLSGERKAPPTAAEIERWRYSLDLVDERMTLLRRQAVADERIEATRPIVDALGPRPEDPDRAEAWAEGVDLIHGFRLRWGVGDAETEPLGARTGDAARQEERRLAAMQLAETRRRLDLPAAEVPLSLEIDR